MVLLQVNFVQKPTNSSIGHLNRLIIYQRDQSKETKISLIWSQIFVPFYASSNPKISRNFSQEKKN